MIALTRALRADRLLLALTLLLAGACLYPLFRTTVVPFIDLPHHAALAGLFWDVIFKRDGAAQHYWIDPTPVPYWTEIVILAVTQRLLGVYLGAKVVVGLALLSVPLGFMRLCLTLGRSPRQGLWAFLLTWDFNLYYGWLNHVLGVGLALFLLAAVLEAETPRDAAKTWPLGVLLALTHVLPVAFFLGALGLATLARPRALVARAIALAAPGLALLPWVLRALAVPHGDSGAVYDPIDVRLASLFKYTLGNGPLAREAMLAEGVAFVVLLFGPLLLFLLPQREGRGGERSDHHQPAAAALLYFFLPLEVVRPVTHWGTYPRFATILLLGVLLLPNPRLSGARALALAPGVLACLWTSREVGAQLRAFDAETAPFFQAARMVTPGARLLALCQENGFPSARLPMGDSLHAYITARVGGFNPYLFDAPTTVVHYLNQGRLPTPGAFGRQPHLFSMKTYGQRYDFILVQGLAGDPVVRDPKGDGKEAVKVFEGGRWRLYQVR